MDHPLSIIVFAVIVTAMLFFDLFVFGKNPHKVTSKEAALWSLFYVGMALAFCAFVYFTDGRQHATEFLTAYAIEKALSVDNLFVFILVFGYFNVPSQYHHKVLFWGIIGAIVLRAIFIFSGAAIINATYLNSYLANPLQYNVNIVITLFGAFLAYAGIKSLFVDDDDDDEDYSKSPGARFVKWAFRGKVADDYDGANFFTRRPVHPYNPPGPFNPVATFATPLLVVVGVIEFTDLLFAVDSIPAIFSVSQDPFILYSSNIFAILGLRTLYFLLANFMHLFRFLKYGLGVILAFIGIKMLVSAFFHIDSGLSLIVVISILLISTIASVVIPKAAEAT